MAQQIAFAETTMPVLGKGRMVRHWIRKIKAAKPAVGKVEMNLFAKPAFRPDAKTIANQQHADQQLWIDRWTATVAVKLCKMRTDTAQIHKPINRT